MVDTFTEIQGCWRGNVTAALRSGVVEFMLEVLDGGEASFASREDAAHAPVLRVTLAD